MKTIAFQGIEGANSHLACLQFYSNHQHLALATFEQIFIAVDTGKVDLGLIPLENSYAGRVAEIHHLLQKYNVNIIAEHFFTVDHHLVAVKGSKINEIDTVISHPQALMQCQDFLQTLPAQQQQASNTAVAAQTVADYHRNTGNKNMAAICSEMAATNHNLTILASNIQDTAKQNTTIFVAIAKKPVDIDCNLAPVITAMLFTIRNIPGSLYKALGGFATNAVSIIKLESYIPGGFSQQAKFFIAIQGHPSQNNVGLALEELGFFSKEVKVLGIYYADSHRKIS
jgi:prephenate dehydratase